MQLQPSQTFGFDLFPLPEPVTGKKKKSYFNPTHLQSPSNIALRSQVKPPQSTPGKQNKHATVSELADTRTRVCKGEVDGGGERNTHIKMEQSKTLNRTQAPPEQYECLLVESFISFGFISLLLSFSRRYLCSRYWAMHWGCVELIRTVIDGRVDDLSFRLNTRLDICLLAAFACFLPVYGNLSSYSLCHWEDTV